MKTSQQIRQEFLDFFERRGHTIVPSASLVPNDPTLLFTNAGMVQFKDVFLGSRRPDHIRVTATQKCLRVSGKHNDLNEVGYDTYHHTFFEMLGNWGFGDYFKKEAIAWAWELLVEQWGLDAGRLYATVHEGDTKMGLEADHEAADLWKSETSIAPDHVIFCNSKDNFWMMGDSGPCGPCSEINIDLRPDEERAKVPGLELVNQGHPRVIEIWNLVFIQYNALPDGTLEPLQQKHVDTGMGFERMVAALQAKDSNYQTDLFTPIMERVREIRGHSPEEMEANLVPYRVLADHGRAMSFLLADGVVPGNEKEKYVLRMIMRRAVRYGKKLGIKKPFLGEVAQSVIEHMGSFYPELQENRVSILKWVAQEEKLFDKTLDRGLVYFEQHVGKLKAQNKTIIPGKDAFSLHDTLGFPIEVTDDLAREHGFTVDHQGFQREMEKQRKRSRASKETVASLVDSTKIQEITGTERTKFKGYKTLSLVDSKVLWVNKDADFGYQVIFDKTSFYAESGGQVGDAGTVTNLTRYGKGKIKNTTNLFQRFVHNLEDLEGDFQENDLCALEVDLVRRKSIQRNHTATHILHAALHHVVGEHAKQAGSYVAPDELRFDFTHFEALKPEEIKEIEQLANRVILDDLEVKISEETLEDAKAKGAMALFAEDYQGKEKVRMVSVLEADETAFSRELCGGTHAQRTGEIGAFKIISEESVSAGVRRVKVVTGINLLNYLDERGHQLQRAATLLETTPSDFLSRLEALLKTNKELQKKLQALRSEQVVTQVDQYLKHKETVGRTPYIIAQTDLSGDELKQLADLLESRLGNGVILLGAARDGQVQLICKVSKALTQQLRAGDIIKSLTPIVGGGGGGAPHFAQGGGSKPDKLAEALEQGKTLIHAGLN